MKKIAIILAALSLLLFIYLNIKSPDCRNADNQTIYKIVFNKVDNSRNTGRKLLGDRLNQVKLGKIYRITDNKIVEYFRVAVTTNKYPNLYIDIYPNCTSDWVISKDLLTNE